MFGLDKWFSPYWKGGSQYLLWIQQYFSAYYQAWHFFSPQTPRLGTGFGTNPSLIQTADALEIKDARVDFPMMGPSKRCNQLPNKGKETPTIGFMSLMSTLSQSEPAPEGSVSQRAAPRVFLHTIRAVLPLLKI
ncbi:hypothetical protein DSO57_1030340 [Entomophthora muscae]|uniref:Uncharacterized protein n=1 Tax=Entomophthora muscae TaxID=34485 RepID=A0ACC2S2T3_9FUNG|nr:hypothetical protein DSO57_1030340 [Entomophthora muscae]